MSAIDRALATLAHASHSVEDLTDEQRDMWRERVAEARREYDALRRERDELLTIALDLLARIERRHDSTDLDWACRECRPDSHMLIPGWVCAVHRMAAIRAAQCGCGELADGSVVP